MHLRLSFLLLSLPLLAGAQAPPDSTVTATSVVAALPAAAVPSPPAALVAAAALPDTPRVALSAPDTALAALQRLSAAAREQRGRADAKRHFRPSRAIFWGSFGAGFVTPPAFIVTANPAVLLPLGGVAVLGAVGPSPERIRASAPRPQLLRDADYQRGYVRKASNKKVSRALVGWGVGATTAMVAVTVALVALFSGGISFGG
ncbi:hypothetical protein [Hymenobacter edaphi]|uniref:Uncharacterized protein n=1 Tax=Hymenobacter edaphi TaxID=2211146 RepID=A0A328BL00_9BACT|nr:hypothetical protein [Hymenobacter edaphi]RAK68142.1 hypothetical protein DLM85_08885 [Hymenobacter edaphi]